MTTIILTERERDLLLEDARQLRRTVRILQARSQRSLADQVQAIADHMQNMACGFEGDPHAYDETPKVKEVSTDAG